MEEQSAVEVVSEKVQAVEAGEAAATSRGDDEVLEGVTIGETLEEVYVLASKYKNTTVENLQSQITNNWNAVFK